MARGSARRAFVGAVVIVLGIGGRAARAEDAPPDPKLARLVALEAKVVTDVTQKVVEALCQDAHAAAELYKEAEGKSPYRERCLKMLGTLAGNKNDDVCKSALTAVGDTGDLDGGGKILRRFLRPSDEADPSVGLTTALQVAAVLPDPDLVEPLLTIVTDSKNYSVAAKAMEALGSYKGAKKKREKILEELTKTTLKDKPGVAPRAYRENQTNPDGATPGNQPGSANRWPTLSAVLPKTLNKLTGQTLGSPEEWADAVKQHKGRLGDLFRDAG